MIDMAINEQFIWSLIIALVSGFLAVKVENWIAKLLFFIAAFGGTIIAVGALGAGVEWVLLFESILLLATGISSIRAKHPGNKVLGIILIVLGGAGVILTLNAFGAAPGTVLGRIAEVIQQGWTGLMGFINQVLGLA